MHSSLILVFGLGISYIVYAIINYIAETIYHARRSRELGCQSAPIYAPTKPFGIKVWLKTMEMARTKNLPSFSIGMQKELSRHEGRIVTTTRVLRFGQEAIFTWEPENLKAVLATQFKDFGLGIVRNKNFHPLLGDGIFNTDGKDWERSRALLRPQFAREQVSDLDLEEAHVQNLMRVLPANKDGWTDTTNIQVLFFRLTLDSATEFLFGESVNSQLAALKPDSTTHKGGDNTSLDERLFAYAFDQGQDTVGQAGRLSSLYWLKHDKAFRNNCKIVHDFADYYVQAALAKQKESNSHDLEKSHGSGKEKYVFIDALAEATKDPVEIRSQILNILLAGRDTTASLLSWCFVVLANHPDVFTKLRSTVLENFGTYNDPSNLTFASLKSCSYLQYFLKEVLRLFPIVPGNSRECMVRSTTLPRGGGPDGLSPIYVRKGTIILYSVHTMQRLECFWGPDSTTFKPERWENKKVGWEYLPFNGGPRICIGQQFALTEASYVLVRMMQRFESFEAEGVPAWGNERHGITLTNCPADGVRVRFKVAAA